MEYKKYEREPYNIYTIKTDKFNSCRMEIILRHKFDKKNVAVDNFLTDFLAFTSLNYPKRRDVVLKLEELYGASFYSNRERIGEMILNNFMVDFLAPNFCDEENYLEEVIKLPFLMLLNPNFKDQEADMNSFKIIMNRLKAEVLYKAEDPVYQCVKEAIKKSFHDKPVVESRIGSIEDLNNITPHMVYEYYQKFIKECVCDIYIIGNLDMDKVVNIIDKYLTLDTIKDDNFNLFITNEITNKINIYEVNGEFTQANLAVVGVIDNIDDVYAFRVFNSLVGGVGLSSKLDQALREKNSLCYSVSLRSTRTDGMFFVHCGIEQSNYKKAVSLIKNVFKEMKNGNFTDEELDNAKSSLLSSNKMGEDSIVQLLNNYLMHQLLNEDLLRDRYSKIRSVTRDDVKNISKKFHLKTIYLLKSGDNNGDN